MDAHAPGAQPQLHCGLGFGDIRMCCRISQPSTRLVAAPFGGYAQSVLGALSGPVKLGFGQLVSLPLIPQNQSSAADLSPSDDLINFLKAIPVARYCHGSALFAVVPAVGGSDGDLVQHREPPESTKPPSTKQGHGDSGG